MSSFHETEFLALINNIFDEKTWSFEDLSMGSDFNEIIDHEDFSRGFENYFLKNLLKKAESLPLEGDPIAAAYEDFTAFLDEQDKVVMRVQHVLDNLHVNPTLQSIMIRARSKFAKFFRDFAPERIYPRFTFGATTGLPRGSSVFARVRASEGIQSLQRNFSRLYDPSVFKPVCVDMGLKPFHQNTLFPSVKLINYLPHTDGSDEFFIKIGVVSKLWKIGRIIGNAPGAVLAYQCGLGDYFSKKLIRYADIDLSTAQELHRELAFRASLDDEYSTLDQRHASDNILRILANWLVPSKVYNYMVAITPDVLEIQGVRRKTHMLCPAGNGFNTAFQTLLFWVLITSIQDEMRITSKVHVYGDDVILHKSAFDAVTRVFPLLGLQVNVDKSFKEGPFRESCGGDYLYGVNIRSFYAKGIPQTTQEWIAFANGIRRVCYYNNDNTWRSRRLRNLWLQSVRKIPSAKRLYGPRVYGDACINTEHTRFYKFAEPRKRDASGRRYPSNGYDSRGNPFSSERIYIYVSQTGGDKTTFAIESQRLTADTVLRLLPHASVKHSGLRIRNNPKTYNGVLEKPVYYPAVYGGKHEAYKKQAVAYSLFGAPPEDVDDLFDHIRTGNGLEICDSRLVVARYVARKQLALRRLVDLLQTRVNTHVAVRDDVVAELMAFAL